MSKIITAEDLVTTSIGQTWGDWVEPQAGQQYL